METKLAAIAALADAFQAKGSIYPDSYPEWAQLRQAIDEAAGQAAVVAELVDQAVATPIDTASGYANSMETSIDGLARETIPMEIPMDAGAAGEVPQLELPGVLHRHLNGELDRFLRALDAVLRDPAAIEWLLRMFDAVMAHSTRARGTWPQIEA